MMPTQADLANPNEFIVAWVITVIAAFVIGLGIGFFARIYSSEERP